MPRAARTPLAGLVAAARDYARRTENRVTMEYVLIRGMNDTDADADRLGTLLRGGPFKINLIPYNPGARPDLLRPDRERVDAFARRLWPRAPVVTVRWSQGPDIAAACGQLRTEVEGLRRRPTARTGPERPRPGSREPGRDSASAAGGDPSGRPPGTSGPAEAGGAKPGERGKT